MTTDTAVDSLLGTSIPTSPKLSEFLVTDGMQEDDLTAVPATPPSQSTPGPENRPATHSAVEGDGDVAMPSVHLPDEATLAAAAAAAMAAAAAQGGVPGLEQQTVPDADVAPVDDLNSYLLAAAAAASVHAQQHHGDDLHKAQSEDSFDSTATPVPNSIYTNGTSVNGSEDEDTRAAVHDQCHKYTGDSTPFPLAIGKRKPGGCAELLAEDGGAQKLNDVPLTEATIELGKTRCYWALLSADHSKGGEPTAETLQFVYLDPVLQQHTAEQASRLVGSNFYDYVHPEERDRVSDDMQKIVESRTLFGSVTRCRYSRLPRMRELLGAVNPPRDLDADKYVEDDNFVAIDIVINWIGDGMLLCFFHAIIDKADDDNDEQHKSDWTNWCGTPPGSFSLRQCDTLWKQVKATPREPAADSGPLHVFQVIEAGVDGKVLLSWPPPRLFSRDVDAQLVTQSDTVAFQDGSYFADDFARLAQGVSIAPGSPSLSDANTSCTRRFRAKHTLTTEGKLRSIESVLIPYGSVILACFHTTFQQQLPSPDPKLVMQARATLQAETERRKADEDISQNAPNKRQRTAEGSSLAQPPASTSQDPLIDPAAAASAPSELKSAVSSAEAATKEPQRVTPAVNGSHPQSSTQTPNVANGHASKTPAAKSKSESSGILANPSLLYASAPAKPPATLANAGRPPNERNTPTPAQNGTTSHSATGADSPNSSQNKACTGCGKINSPEWRRGPSGHKTLCNACGLRYARSLTRRKKKKGKDGEVEFIEPTGDPSIVPKSRGGGGGSLPGVHRKNSKRRKEEEAAKAAAMAASTGASALPASAPTGNPPAAQATSTTASSSPATATQSPATATPASLPASPAVDGKPKVTAPPASEGIIKAEPTASAPLSVNAADAPASTLPTDPTHSMAVSIALDLMAHATSSVPSLDADVMSLPVSDAISRAIAATIGSTSGAHGLVTSQALSSASEAIPSITVPVIDHTPATEASPAAAAISDKTEPIAAPTVDDAGALDLSHALTADAIRAAAQAAIAQGIEQGES